MYYRVAPKKPRRTAYNAIVAMRARRLGPGSRARSIISKRIKIARRIQGRRRSFRLPPSGKLSRRTYAPKPKHSMRYWRIRSRFFR